MYGNMFLPNPSATCRMWHKVSFNQRKAALNSEFSFSLTGFLTKAKVSSLPYYFYIDGGRTDFLCFFLRTLACSGIQTAPFRIWSPVTNLLSYDDIPNTKRWSKTWGNLLRIIFLTQNDYYIADDVS